MDDLRQRHGDHTWDIVIEYVRCPNCGYIIENREKYESQFGQLKKGMRCNRCKHAFTVVKRKHRSFGPLWGEAK